MKCPLVPFAALALDRSIIRRSAASGENLVRHLSGNVGQSKIPPGVAIG